MAVSASSVQAEARVPLRDQPRLDGDSLCYRRDYDAAHLKRHPGPARQRALLLLKKDATGIANGRRRHVRSQAAARRVEWNLHGGQ